MKQIIPFLACLVIGIGIGWYLGYTRSTVTNQRELLKQYQYFKDHTQEFEAGVAHYDELAAKSAAGAKPFETSTTSMALAALKALDANDVETTRSRLTAILAVYYAHYSHDGETNLLGDIKNFAAADIVLSNAIGSGSLVKPRCWKMRINNFGRCLRHSLTSLLVKST